jgi:hypothetical protein
MVTGGDDKKVNVWAVGKANAILVRPLRNPWDCADGQG